MKSIDYYAVPQPWRMSRWVLGAMGVIFAAIAFGSGVVIVQLVRDTTPVATAPAPAPVLVLVPAPVLSHHDANARTTVVPAAGVAAPQPVARADKRKKHLKSKASRRHAAKARKRKASTRIASAKRTPAPAMTDVKAASILAKHDNKSSRRDKDALDKLLGM